MNTCELTILMPCLNEAETLARCIQKAKKFLEMQDINGEILVADNGSTDGSQQIALAHGARIIIVRTRGYGAALKAGIQAARGRYIIMGDADDSYDFLNLMPFLTKLRDGHDLVMGNRFAGGITSGAMPFLNRYLGNPILSFFGRNFFKTGIGDFHCGLRGFKRESYLRLEMQGDGMEFASEMVVKAALQNQQITEVPTQLFPDGRGRRSHLRPWRDGWRHLRLLLLFCPRWLFFYPGLCLMTLGMLTMLRLMFGPIEIGNVNLDIHTMLFSCLFMVTGLQAVSFSIYAKMVADFHTKTNSTNKYFPQILKHFTLERGLLIGLGCILVGGMGACYTFWYWFHQSFGPLVPTQMMRIIIPSITLLILGTQLMFGSFFMSMLGLHYSQSQETEVSTRLVESTET